MAFADEYPVAGHHARRTQQPAVLSLERLCPATISGGNRPPDRGSWVTRPAQILVLPGPDQRAGFRIGRSGCLRVWRCQIEQPVSIAAKNHRTVDMSGYDLYRFAADLPAPQTGSFTLYNKSEMLVPAIPAKIRRFVASITRPDPLLV